MKFDNEQLRLTTSNILLEIGIPYNINGSRYLSRAVDIAIHNPDAATLITKKIYPIIASESGTKPSNVERAIRHAIEIAWNKNKIVYLNQLFSIEIYDSHYKPSNSEFIALLAERIPYLLDDNNDKSHFA